jgi:hypothetical protein
MPVRFMPGSREQGHFGEVVVLGDRHCALLAIASFIVHFMGRQASNRFLAHLSGKATTRPCGISHIRDGLNVNQRALGYDRDKTPNTIIYRTDGALDPCRDRSGIFQCFLNVTSFSEFQQRQPLGARTEKPIDGKRRFTKRAVCFGRSILVSRSADPPIFMTPMGEDRRLG